MIEDNYDKNSLRQVIDYIHAEVIESNTTIVSEKEIINLTKFNKIGGHSVIYKYKKFLIKELNDENIVYNKISSEYPELNEFLPSFEGTLKLCINGQTAMYMMIEDLTAHLREPYIIDLKMGTRQYGLHASASKKESQQAKCRNSTSIKLGIRLCGLQVIEHQQFCNDENASQNKIYNIKNIKLFDKFYGRTLDEQEFLDNLVRFLNNTGNEFSILIKALHIINDLKKIYDCVEKLNYFRFYGSSILMVYDNSNDSKVAIKLIDFSKSFISTKQEFTDYFLLQTKDFGFLKGLHTLISLFRLIFETVSGITINDNESKLIESISERRQDFTKAWDGEVNFQYFNYEYDSLVSE